MGWIRTHRLTSSSRTQLHRGQVDRLAHHLQQLRRSTGPHKGDKWTLCYHDWLRLLCLAPVCNELAVQTICRTLSGRSCSDATTAELNELLPLSAGRHLRNLASTLNLDVRPHIGLCLWYCEKWTQERPVVVLLAHGGTVDGASSGGE